MIPWTKTTDALPTETYALVIWVRGTCDPMAYMKDEFGPTPHFCDYYRIGARWNADKDEFDIYQDSGSLYYPREVVYAWVTEANFEAAIRPE